jgi:hypothetical protein
MISERIYQPWFDWKAQVAEQTGISFGIDYSALYLASNNDAGNANAGGGMVRLFGSWDLLGRGTKRQPSGAGAAGSGGGRSRISHSGIASPSRVAKVSSSSGAITVPRSKPSAPSRKRSA